MFVSVLVLKEVYPKQFLIQGKNYSDSHSFNGLFPFLSSTDSTEDI